MRRRLAAVLLSTLGCASVQRLDVAVDPQALRAGDGRVAVRVESPGGAQRVTVVPRGTEVTQRREVTPWCTTPCTLHLPPGEHTLWTGAPAVLDAVSTVRVTDRTTRVELRAPSRPRWERGRNVLVGAIGLTVLGGIFMAFSPLEVTGGSPTGPETIAVGATLSATGTALIVYGLRTMQSEAAGVARVE